MVLSAFFRIFVLNKLFKQTNKTQMKKVIAIFAIASTLVACGGKGTTEATTDSTAVVVDSAVVNSDTTAVAPAEPTTPTAPTAPADVK